MNFKTTIVLSVLVAVVAAVVFFNDRQSKPDTQFFNFKADKIRWVGITARDGRKTVLQRSGDSWRLLEPINARADKYRVQELLSSLVGLKSLGEPSKDVSDFGLDKPSYLVEVTTDDSQTVKLEIGSPGRLGDVQFARVVGRSDVQTIGASLAKALKTAAEDLRDKGLLDTDSRNVRQLRIVSAGQDLSLVQMQAGGKWTIVSPQRLPGDSGEIDSLLRTVTDMQATEFPPASSRELKMAMSSFDHPTVQVWIGQSAPATLPATTQPTQTSAPTLVIVAADKQSEAAITEPAAPRDAFVKLADGTVAKISSSTVESLLKTPLDLRDREVTQVIPDDVTSVAVVRTIYATTRPAAPTTQSSTTQPSTPTTRPSPTVLEERRIVLIRRPAVTSLLGPPVPVTRPSTQGSTQPTTLPATQPAEPPSGWQLVDRPTINVDDAKVSTLLQKLDPLKAEKFRAEFHNDNPVKQYRVEWIGKDFHGWMEVTDSGPDQPPMALCQGALFEVSRDLVNAMDSDFLKAADSKDAPPPPKPAMPSYSGYPPMQ